MNWRSWAIRRASWILHSSTIWITSSTSSSSLISSSTSEQLIKTRKLAKRSAPSVISGISTWRACSSSMCWQQCPFTSCSATSWMTLATKFNCLPCLSLFASSDCRESSLSWTRQMMSNLLYNWLRPRSTSFSSFTSLRASGTQSSQAIRSGSLDKPNFLERAARTSTETSNHKVNYWLSCTPQCLLFAAMISIHKTRCSTWWAHASWF